MVKRRRAMLGVGLVVGLQARAEIVEIPTCEDLRYVLEEYCTDENTLVLDAGLSCDLYGADLRGPCTITAEQPCSATLTNSVSRPAISVRYGELTLDGLALACQPGTDSYVLSIEHSNLSITNSCLDGTECELGLVGTEDPSDPPESITIASSTLTGPSVELLYGAEVLIVRDSIIESSLNQNKPTIMVDQLDRGEIERSMLVSGSDEANLLRVESSTLTLSHDMARVPGAEQLLYADDSNLTLTQSAFVADGGGESLDLSGSAVSLDRNLFTGFDIAILDESSSLDSHDDLWVDVVLATSSGTLEPTILNAAEAGLASLPGEERFCFLPPDCDSEELCTEDARCQEDLPIWPLDACSALVLSDSDGGYLDMLGPLGDPGALADAPSNGPPWLEILGDGDGDGVADDDGDTWVDDLDRYPEDGERARASWFMLVDDACTFLEDTCEDQLSEPNAWTEYTPGEFPEECSTTPDPLPCDGDTSGDTACGEVEASAVVTAGTGCGRRTLSQAWLLSPILMLFALRRLRRAEP